MFASIDVASPDLPRRMSSKACLTAPKSGPEAAVGAAGGAESFDCSATGVTRPDSLRATSVGRGRGRGMDLGLASETVPSASQARAVTKARREATAVPGNFIGPDDGDNGACRIGDSLRFGKRGRFSFWTGRRRPLGPIPCDRGRRRQARRKPANFGFKLSLGDLPADHGGPA